MSKTRQQRAFEILDAVLAAAPAERRKLLAELCGDDEALRREVQSMLELESSADAFLELPAVDLDAARTQPPLDELEPDARVGPYRIVEVLGRGGMGAVYRATREDDFEKQVALKMVRRDLANSSAGERFHAERQILAHLDHPGIARLLDGGATDDGRPFLVMECVDGLPITQYCAVHRLGVRARLELFREVLAAVAYAHQNLVVHRDLKPSNILVGEDGKPKLLDFGIAKLLARGDDPDDVATDSDEHPMTLRYASPEQVAGDPIGAASDVYSLGVLLYEVLTGQLPCGLGDCPPREMPRRIVGEEPGPASSAISDDHAARCAERTKKKLRRRLTGDLDAILAMVLRKEPQHRYASADRFSADLYRHLDGLPVLARRGAWTYRALRLTRRYRYAVAAVLLILIGSVISTVQWRRAERERDRAETERIVAEQERDRAQRVADFLKRVIKSADPDIAQGHELTAREILDEGRQQLAGGGFGNDPELAAELAGTLGDVYRDLGIYDAALELLKRSVDLRRKLYPTGHPDLAVALNDLAGVYYYLADYDQAARFFRETLTMRRRLGEEPEPIARALSNLASTLKQQGLHAEAGALYREALAIREEVDGPDSLETASSLYALGALEHESGRLAEAEDLLRRALAIRLREYGEMHTRTATVMGSLGRTLQARGELEEAEDLLRRALAVRVELLGEDHPHVALSRADLAAVQRR